MVSNNICKISYVRSSDLICTNFVYEETDIQSNTTLTDKYILGFVVEGKGELDQDGKIHAISKGDAFFVRKNLPFRIKREERLTYFYISFYGRRADELVERFGLSEHFCVFGLLESHSELTALAFDCLSKATEQNTDIFGECGLLYLLAHLNIAESKYSGLLSDMMTLTNKSFTDPDFSLNSLAATMGYAPKYLSFFFKKNKGICYSQYLRELRIRHSVFLMEQGVHSVKNVALLSGFGDTFYFSKIFKK